MKLARFELIQAYMDAGWAVLPLDGKTPINLGWRNLVVTANELPKYFGKGENIGLILGERSGGLVDVDLDSTAAIQIAPLLLPATPVKFGRASMPLSHWIYVSPGSATRQYKTAADGSLVELRADGVQTMFPPSIHPSGETVEFAGITDGELSKPAEVDSGALDRAVRRVAAAALLGIHWPKTGARHDGSLALAGGLLGAGWGTAETEQFIRATCEAAQDEEANDRVASVDDTIRKIRTGTPTTGWTRLAELVGKDAVNKARKWLNVIPRFADQDTIIPTPGNFFDTDIGNGERLAARHSDKLRYVWVGSSGYWMAWDGKRWIESQAIAEALAKETVRSIYAEAHARAEEDDKQRGKKWAHQSEGSGRVSAMLARARSESVIAATPDLFDQSPWILNLQNGHIDLREHPVVLHPHDPALLITKVANCNFDPQSKCPIWNKTLERIFDGDAELIAYVQAMFGYCLSGSTKEQKFWICWGAGANGKSTALNAIRYILGDYAQQANTSTILLGKSARSGDVPRSDLANTRKVRLLCAVELAQGQRLDDSLIKLVTGGEPLTARKLYQGDAISFVPEFKLLLGCNHKPSFPPDSAMARRIRLIPFTVTIPLEEQDHELTEKLRAEASGILNFCLQGFHLWHRMSWLSSHEPPIVKSATDDYLRELDPLTPFLDECCEIGPWGTHKTQSTDLFNAYKAFTKSNPEFGGEGDSTVVFSYRMQDAGSRNGVEKKKLKGKKFWCGIRLKADAAVELAVEAGGGG